MIRSPESLTYTELQPLSSLRRLPSIVKMTFAKLLAVLPLALGASAAVLEGRQQSSSSSAAASTTVSGSSGSSSNSSSSDPFRKINISSPDSSIRASFLPFGATVQELYVSDRWGNMRDLVLGFDDPKRYAQTRDFFGPVVGRYANRIKNGTFELDGETYHTPLNEK